MKNGIIVLIAVLAAALLFSGCAQPAEPKACTEEAMECPDGSYVARNPALDCEFDACPEPQATPAITPPPALTPTPAGEQMVSEAVGDVAQDLGNLLKEFEAAGEDID